MKFLIVLVTLSGIFGGSLVLKSSTAFIDSNVAGIASPVNQDVNLLSVSTVTRAA